MKLVSVARGGIFAVILLTLPLFNLQHWFLNIMVFVLMFATMSSAWNLVGGFAGYPSLGHAAFFGIGAYSLAIYFEHHAISFGLEPFLTLPFVFVIGFLIGVPIAWVSMRTRADVFAIVTITFLFVVQTIAFNWTTVTGGSQGIITPNYKISNTYFEWPYYYVLAVMLLGTMALTFYTMRSKVGLSLVSIRADEDKALGIGVRTTGVKVLAFSVSVGITAMVGAVWAYYTTGIYPQFAIDPLITIAMVLMTFLGGRGTLWGPVLGAFILESAQQTLAYQLGGAQVYLIVYSLVFIVIIRFLPRGIIPTIEDKLRLRKRRIFTDAPPPGSVSTSDPVPALGGGAA